MATMKEKRTCGQRCEDFGNFVWNSDNGTFMGRTPAKWVYISLYYVAFYAVMTGLFSLSIWVLMYTLSPYTPDYQDRLQSPGVMVWPNTYGEEIVEITYNRSNKLSWMKMSNILKNFLEPYNETIQQSRNNYTCTKGKYFFQSQFSAPHHTKWSCPFCQSMLGACSGISDPTFGYNCTMPCVIIKMNRNHPANSAGSPWAKFGLLSHNLDTFYGGTPQTDLSSNAGVGSPMILRVDPVAIMNGSNAEDKSTYGDIKDGSQNIADIKYFPPNGTMDRSYFPYYGNLAQPNYVNPLVAVRFSLVNQKQATIQCRVVADKISYENIHDPYEGKVTFSLKAES